MWAAIRFFGRMKKKEDVAVFNFDSGMCTMPHDHNFQNEQEMLNTLRIAVLLK